MLCSHDRFHRVRVKVCNPIGPGDRCRARLIAVVLAVAGLVGSAPAEAQSGSVAGTVLGGDGDPVVAATVELAGTGLTATTDAGGRYRIPRVPAGTYLIRFTRIGHAAHAVTVTVRGGEAVTFDVTLPARALALRPVEVLAQRTRLVGRGVQAIPGSAHHLTREDLDHTVTPYADVHAVLRQIPGVNVQEEEGYGLRPNIGMRGTGSERSSNITVMEDGILTAPAPYAAPAAYYFPTIGRMDGVEVRKGSSQIKYGPRTIGGALNLVSTPIPEQLVARADVVGGEDNTVRVRGEIGDAYRNIGWLAQTYQIRTDGFKRLDTGGPTGYGLEDYLVKLRVNTNPEASLYQELELRTSFTTHRSDETYLGLTEQDFRSTPFRRYAASQEDVINTEHRLLAARHFFRPGDAFDLTTTAYRSDFARTWYKLQSVGGRGLAGVLRDPSQFAAELDILRGGGSGSDALVVRNNDREYYAHGVQTVAAVQFGTGSIRHGTEVGLRIHADAEDRLQEEDAYQMLNGTMVLTTPGARGTQANRVGKARAVAGFIQHRLQAGRLTVTPGLRYETIDLTRTDYAAGDVARTTPERVREHTVTAWVPGVGVHVAVTGALNVFGGLHRGFAPPGPGAASETRAEESLNYELGTRLRTGGVEASAVGFFSDYRNILGQATIAVGETGAGDQFNGGAVDVVGVELALTGAPAVGASGRVTLPFQANYTFTRATFQTSFESDFGPWGTVTAGDHLPYIPAHQFHARAGVRSGGWFGGASVNVSSAMRTMAGSGAIFQTGSTDRYVVLNAQAEYDIAPWSTVLLAVQNVTDQRYVVARRPAGARPGLPRTIVGGVRLNR